MSNNPHDTRTRVALLVRKMEIGGSERQALELAKGLPRDQFEATVLTFYPGGEFAEEAEQSGIKVISLNKQGRWDLLGFQFRLILELRNLKVGILHAFDGPPGLLSLLARPFVPGLKVIWGIRASDMDLSRFDYSRRIVFRMLKRLSGRADLVIANSDFGMSYVRDQGFSEKNLSVVHNGIDMEYFSPHAADPTDLRKTWGDAAGQILIIGIVARLDPMKDHDTFLRAATTFLENGGNARFVCVGDGTERRRLESLAEELGISGNVHWAGTRSDMPNVFAALDINTLTSTTEGFPNTLGEAMACATSCVSTDVGDAALILGDTGTIVNVGDSSAIAKAWADLSDMSRVERDQLGWRCRARISERFSVQAMVSGNISLYKQLLATRG